MSLDRRMRDGSSIAPTKGSAVSWPAAGPRGSRHASYVGVDRGDRRHHGSPSRNQTSHGGGKTRDPFACFESLVDEGGGESPREPDPEHDRQTSDLIFQGYSLEGVTMRAVVIVVAMLTCSTWQQITTCAGPDGYRSNQTTWNGITTGDDNQGDRWTT